ncbi:MAG: ABC transporter ATP-binding protein [Thermofilaceae archaeon]
MVLAVVSRNLSIGYEELDSVVWAVKNVSLEIERGSSFCLAGESGCGKSTLASAIAGILPPHAVTRGVLLVNGKSVINNEVRDYEGVRGRRVTYIPQNPGSSLSPYLKIGRQFYHVLNSLHGLEKREAFAKARDYLRKVELNPDDVLDRYPHELSGGMQQRAAIALALSTGAELLVADEPTSALDAHLRLQIVELLRKLREENGLTLIFISHDLLLASALCEKSAVMYAGRIVEIGDTRSIMEAPAHPYTRMLIGAIPRLGDKRPLRSYPGEPPRPGEEKAGCPFYGRCPSSIARCVREKPPLVPVSGGHYVECWLYA